MRREGSKWWFPESSVDLLQGATVDWVESMQGSGFKVENPNIVPIGEGIADGPLADRVKQVIEMQVNPAIASHGGGVDARRGARGRRLPRDDGWVPGLRHGRGHARPGHSPDHHGERAQM